MCLDKACHWHQYIAIKKIEKIINAEIKGAEILGVRQIKILSWLWFNSCKPEYVLKVSVTDQTNQMYIKFIGIYYIPYPWRIWEQVDMGLAGEFLWENTKEYNIGLIEYKENKFYLNLKGKALSYIPECE